MDIRKFLKSKPDPVIAIGSSLTSRPALISGVGLSAAKKARLDDGVENESRCDPASNTSNTRPTNSSQERIIVDETAGLNLPTSDVHNQIELMDDNDKVPDCRSTKTIELCEHRIAAALNSSDDLRAEIERSNSSVIACFPSEPYQPPADSIDGQFAGKGKRNCLKFQKSWYEQFPWIHFDTRINAVICFTCAKAESLHLSDLARKRESTFITTGFSNWKKAKERFAAHQHSGAHRFAIEQVYNAKSRPTIDGQIMQQKNEQQLAARKCLHKIFTSARFLARQGLAFRGHDTDDGNFKQMLLVRSEDSQDLAKFLQTKNDMTSGVRQNEIIEMFSHTIVRDICTKVRQAGAIAIIVDGTQDVSGKEQESICVRYVDESLNPVESFIGMFDSSDSTTGQSIANSVFDVLIRLQLPLVQLRGQTFDGASNMSGIYKGCQAIISNRQPLALYTHCGSHCTNLVAERVTSLGPLVRNSMQVVQEIGSLFSASIHCRTTFVRMSLSSESASMKKIKPLCPTRWLVRVPAIKDILGQYPTVLQTMDELSAASTAISARAQGLATQLRHGSTLIGLNMALLVLEPLESLNRSLQSRATTVAGMLQAVQLVIESLQSLRCEKVFDDLLDSVNKRVNDLDLDEVTIPRQRRPPARVTGAASAFQASSISQHYAPQFFEAIDTATTGLKQRFTESKGLQDYGKLEAFFLGDTGQELNVASISRYPELNTEDLRLQLSMFHKKHAHIKHIHDATVVFQKMVPEVRAMFDQVETLLRLLLVCPASSAEAERSFSGLRRLKTWLRSTMNQTRLNSVCICHIHQDLLDAIKINDLLNDFCSRSDVRMKLFGRC